MKKTLKTFALSAAAAIGLSSVPAMAQDQAATSASDVEYTELNGNIDGAESYVRNVNALVADTAVANHLQDPTQSPYVCIDEFTTFEIDFNQAVQSSMDNVTFGEAFTLLRLNPQMVTTEEEFRSISNTFNLCARTSNVPAVQNLLGQVNEYNANTFGQIRFFEALARDLIVPVPTVTANEAPKADQPPAPGM